MESLSKHQLILVALLISFVTSLATGIVTVSLMDQVPRGVQQSITQVIERTIQSAVPQDASVASAPLSFQDQTAAAVSAVSSSIVKIRSRASNALVGTGLIMNSKGVIFTDKSTVAQVSDYIAVLSDGTIVPVTIIQSEIDGDNVFLAPLGAASAKASFTPITAASSTSLGQTAFALSGTSTPVLGQGIITEMGDLIQTSIPGSRAGADSPLFDMNGDVIGIRTSSLPENDGTSFYPIGNIQAVVPSL